jgi:NAD(P)-dependent dehydrogenase (short-subunit alcohol dehydrogenase family)
MSNATVNSQQLDGQVALITGASSGMGTATATALARMGARVVLLCRDAARGAKAVETVKSQSGSEKVELLLADLASQRSIREAAAEFKRRHSKLHILVNNAGVNLGQRVVTPDGLEATFAINHLGPFLLTHLLLDVLKASAPSRIVNVGSGAHKPGKIRLDDLQFERKYSAFQAYAQSKLANVLFTYELARRLKGTSVDVNCADPGVVATSLGSDQLIFRLIVKLPFLQTPAQGSQTAIHLASAPELKGVTGKYFIKSQEKPSSKASYDEKLARELWDVSARLTGLEAATTRAA